MSKKKPTKKTPKPKVEKPPKPYSGKGGIRAKVLDKNKVKTILNISDNFIIGEYILTTKAEYYDLIADNAIELSEGEKKNNCTKKKENKLF